MNTLSTAIADIHTTVQEHNKESFFFKKALDENAAYRESKGWRKMDFKTEDAINNYVAGTEAYKARMNETMMALLNDINEYKRSLAKKERLHFETESGKSGLKTITSVGLNFITIMITRACSHPSYAAKALKAFSQSNEIADCLPTVLLHKICEQLRRASRQNPTKLSAYWQRVKATKNQIKKTA